MLIRLSTLAFAASILSAPSLVACLSPSDIPADTPVSKLLASAQGHLSRGETSDALAYYDAAIARDPTNYLTFFKRATTYLSLGRTSQATDDFQRVLSLKPGFEGAHVQLGKLKARHGDWDAAKEHYEKAKRAEELASLEEAKGAATLAEAAAKEENWEECVKQADDAILTANRALSLRELRARCAFERGAMERGIGDLQHILQMKPGDTSPHVKISAIQFYALGELQEGMASIRKCLHSDPESKECKRMLKIEKQVDKVVQKVTKALEKNQHMTAVRQLVPSTDGEGLIKEVKDQVHMLREDGTIPKAAGNVLIARLVEMACQAYHEVSLCATVMLIMKAISNVPNSQTARRPRSIVRNRSNTTKTRSTACSTAPSTSWTRKSSRPASTLFAKPPKPTRARTTSSTRSCKRPKSPLSVARQKTTTRSSVWPTTPTSARSRPPTASCPSSTTRTRRPSKGSLRRRPRRKWRPSSRRTRC